MKIDLNIEKDENSRGVYFHRTPGIKCSHTKRQASMDISKYIQEEGGDETNYVFREYLVLNYCKHANKVIRF